MHPDRWQRLQFYHYFVLFVGSDCSGHFPSIDNKTCSVTDMSSADRHRFVTRIDDREFLTTTLLLDWANGPKGWLRMFEISVLTMTTGERPYKFTFGSEFNQLFARINFAITINFDIGTTTKLGIEL
jgi:hypothetical protein